MARLPARDAMNEGVGTTDASGVFTGSNLAQPNIDALLLRVAAAMSEIEQAKQERSTGSVRAARTQLAAFHGVARLRRQAENQTKVA